MKNYYLYLDESGDFDKDLESKRKRACLVGGFLFKEGDFGDSDIKAITGDYSTKNNHATELNKLDKGMLVYRLLSKANKYPLEFVIFEDDKKLQILNSTTTYLTVLTEGIMQLLKHLVMREADAVTLNVIAGYKKDAREKITNSMVDGYISLSEYDNHIRERIIVEKAKLKGNQLADSKVNINLADDKRNNYLILCDYICNFWFTMPAAAFDAEVNGAKIRDIVKQYYKTEFIFPLFISEEKDHVLRMIQDGTYADALFEGCNGLLSMKSQSLVKEGMLKLSDKALNQQLDGLSQYIGSVIDSQREFSIGEKIIHGAESLLAYLHENGREVLKYDIDVKLYRLAICNHTKLIDRMEAVMKELEPKIRRYTQETLNIDYFVMYFNRKAVWLQEQEKYTESYEVCKKLENFLSLILISVTENECLTYDGEDLKSEQLGKVLGTKLQALIAMCRDDKNYVSEARLTSDMAIKQFSLKEDIYRQYQYRSQLEAVAGDIESAVSWIEKSFHNTRWEVLLSGNEWLFYDLYNLLLIAIEACKNGQQELGKKIAKKVKNCGYKKLNINCQEIINENLEKIKF